MLIGEAPGKNEIERGRAFVGKPVSATKRISQPEKEAAVITNAVKFE